MFYHWVNWQAHATPFSKYLFGGMYDETVALLLHKPKKKEEETNDHA